MVQAPNVLSNIRRCDVPGWKVILMIISHMFLLLPLQERQSCRGELTTRSSFSLGKLNPFDVQLHVSICDSYRTPMIFICIPVRTFFDFSSFIFFLARFCFVWFFVYLSYKNENVHDLNGRNVEADRKERKRDFWRQ
jgi:hypothetical protein